MKKVVTIGGGTGSYTLLSGIKNIPDIELSAIVAMTDDGGSTGVLRDELGVLPPGDVRQCLVALSEQEDVLRKLMSYRFEEGSLAGHSFGNILLAGLEKVTGSFTDGVEIASDILKVKGQVIPITESIATLHVILSNGDNVRGEDTINQTHFKEHTIQELYIDETVSINPHAKDAIECADYIIIGPGNHYCSILPNLIISGCRNALAKSTAKIIYIPNLTNKKGHTLGWTVEDYVNDIESYLGKNIDIIVVNDEAPSNEQVKIYQLEEGENVLTKNTTSDDERIITKPLMSRHIITNNPHDSIGHLRGFIRHDSQKLGKILEEIINA
jgi:uncharacterized cofD-like protein